MDDSISACSLVRAHRSASDSPANDSGVSNLTAARPALSAGSLMGSRFWRMNLPAFQSLLVKALLEVSFSGERLTSCEMEARQGLRRLARGCLHRKQTPALGKTLLAKAPYRATLERARGETWKDIQRPRRMCPVQSNSHALALVFQAAEHMPVW